LLSRGRPPPDAAQVDTPVGSDTPVDTVGPPMRPVITETKKSAMGIGEIAQKAEAVKGAARSTSAAPPATARGAGTSSDAQNSGISARVMQTGAGTLALIAAGVIIVAVGGYHAYKGASRNFSTTSEARPATWRDHCGWWATSPRA
jgi:hypothetical protein